MPNQYSVTGLWTPSKTEVRGVEKPFFVIVNGKDEPKKLHKNLVDAIDHMLEERRRGRPTGLLKVHCDYTKMVEPIKPKVEINYSPLEFSIYDQS